MRQAGAARAQVVLSLCNHYQRQMDNRQIHQLHEKWELAALLKKNFGRHELLQRFLLDHVGLCAKVDMVKLAAVVAKRSPCGRGKPSDAERARRAKDIYHLAYMKKPEPLAIHLESLRWECTVPDFGFLADVVRGKFDLAPNRPPPEKLTAIIRAEAVANTVREYQNLTGKSLQESYGDLAEVIGKSESQLKMRDTEAAKRKGVSRGRGRPRKLK